MPKTKTKSKAVSSVISYVLVFVIALALTSSAYMYTVPRLADMKSKSELEYMTVYMKRLDDKIKTVSHGGEGSKDYISVNIEQGMLSVCDIGDKIEYSIMSNACLQIDGITGLHFETKEDGMCINKIILNYTSVDIASNSTLSGVFQLYIENVGFQNNKPILRVV